MPSTADIGVDIVKRVMQELSALQGDIANLQKVTTSVESSLKQESTVRESEIRTLHVRFDAERAAETLMRGALENRQKEFETSMDALGRDTIANKFAALETAVAERIALAAAFQEQRLKELEGRLTFKSSVADLNVLMEKVKALQDTVAENKKAEDQAVKKALEAEAQDFKVSQDSLRSLQQQCEENKKALLSDIASLSAEIKTKGLASNLATISDRLHTLSLDVAANSHRAEADKGALQTHIGSLQAAHTKLERQLEADRNRSMQCAVALETELKTKAAKADTEEKIELHAGNFDGKLKMYGEDMLQIKSRVVALEQGKADAVELPQLRSSLLDQAFTITKQTTKQDSLHTCQLKHDEVLQEHEKKLQESTTIEGLWQNKVDQIESRVIVLERQVTTKAEALSGDPRR